MQDIPMGWATLIAAGVTSLAGLAAVVVTAVLGARTRRDVKQVAADARASARDVAVVKEQVKNSHDTNLREEQDERHAENNRKLDKIIATQKRHTRDIGFLQRSQAGMRVDINRLADADQEQTRSDHRLSDRLHELERTNPQHTEKG